MLFAPLNVAAFMNIPKEMRGAAVGLLALLRNEGGSVGTSIAQTIQERREQFHILRLGENLDPLNPAVTNFITETNRAYLQLTGDPSAAQQMALQTLSDLRGQQALTVAYFDTFVSFAALSFVLVFLVFMMKRAVAQKGAHIAAE
jgi:DHA2 family multidrug resistance protein